VERLLIFVERPLVEKSITHAEENLFSLFIS